MNISIMNYDGSNNRNNNTTRGGGEQPSSNTFRPREEDSASLQLQQRGEDERRGYCITKPMNNNNDASSSSSSSRWGVCSGENVDAQGFHQQRPYHHYARDRETTGREHHPRHHQGGNRRWKGDEEWTHSEERKWRESRDGAVGRSSRISCLECGLSMDKLRCERCPRCKTGIDTSSSAFQRPSGDFGGGVGTEGGRSTSAYNDDAALTVDQQERRYRHHHDDCFENDGKNYYYTRPSDRGPRSSRGGDGSDHYYDRDYDNYHDGRDGPRKKKKREESYDNDDGNDAPRKNKSEWPPCFESSGASFIFDVRSGLFYEPASDFFYDPKTKLYYSNARQQYFTYDIDREPNAFLPIGGDGGITASLEASPQEKTDVEEVPAESSTPGLPVSSLTTKHEKTELTKKIAISLKTPLPPKDSGIKSLNNVAAMEKIKLSEQNLVRKESASSTTGGDLLAVSAGILPQAHKKHALDMSKWSERVKEMREEGSVTEILQQEPMKKTTVSNEIKTTASGQPMCVLCRRKFANVDKLRQHEKLSELHKENLAKKASAIAATEPTATASLFKKEEEESEKSYRDRSKERRLMYGSHIVPQSSHAEALLAHSLGPSSLTTSSDAKITQIIRPEETLNDTNVGNKLLQKLGWKSGDTLGRTTKDGLGPNNSEDSVTNNLRSDWERIESLAQGGGMRR